MNKQSFIKMMIAMFISIVGLTVSAQGTKRTIHVEKAGTLSSYISEDEKYQIDELTLTGEINGEDFKLLREMAGKSTMSTDQFNYLDTEGILTVLDISGVRIVAGGSYMYWEGVDHDEIYSLYHNNEIPAYVFRGCSKLIDIKIPNDVNIVGINAFSGTAWYNNQPDGIVYIGNVVYSYKGEMPVNTTLTINDGIIGIASGAFGGFDNLTSIIIPNSVTHIGDHTFSNCRGLTSVSIPNSVSTIEEYTFNHCSSLISVSIPSNVTTIEEYAFWKCTDLTSIIIPNGVTTIKHCSFYECGSLSSVIIPNSIKSIGDGAFCGCSSLASITIPGSVTSIGNEAFSSCSSLATIIVENGNSVYDSRDNCNAIIEKSTNSLIAGCKNSTIPSSVTSIGRFAFAGAVGLSSITIPNNVKTIEYDAFYNCSGLSTVTFPNSLQSIESSAFYGCINLTSIVSEIMNPFEISDYVFSSDNYDIYAIAKLIVPDGTKDKYQSTKGWKNFQKIVEASGGSSEDVRKFESGGIKYIINDNGTSVTVTAGNSKYKGSISIPSSVSNNGKNYDVTSIGYCAFGDCTGLTSISIPNSVMFIQYGAFQNCSGLTSITLPNSIGFIAEYAFMGCSSLKTIESEIQNPFVIEANTFGEDTYKTAELIVPQGTKSAYESTAGWSLFANITSPSSSDVVVEDNVVYEIEGGSVAVVHADDVSGDVTIEASVVINGETYDVTIIAEEAFRDCAEMTSVEIPNSITIIGEKAFNGCSGLRVIKIGKGILEIAKKAFANIFTSAGTRGEDDGLHFYCDAELVPATSAEAFEGTDIAHATLHVPDNLVETYKVVTPWNGFGTIVGLTETGIIDVSDDLSDVQIFDMQGNRLDKPRKGLNIIRTKDGKAKKVVMR